MTRQKSVSLNIIEFLIEIRCYLQSDFSVSSFLSVSPQDQANAVSMTVPHVQLINPENQIVEVSFFSNVRNLRHPAVHFHPLFCTTFLLTHVTDTVCVRMRSLMGRWHWTVMKGKSQVQRQWRAICP